MRKFSISLFGALALTIILSAFALAQWGNAELESVAATGDNERTPRSALALDNQGNLHLLYKNQTGDPQYYYLCKPNGGDWSLPEGVVVNNAPLNSPYLAVDESNGKPYIAFLQNGELMLATKVGGVWVNYPLLMTGMSALFNPAITVDGQGYVHLAITVQYSGEYKIACGYWDGQDFSYQIIYDSQLGAFGSGANPVISAKSNQSVAIAYRGGGYLNYTLDVAENSSLGGSTWTIVSLSQPGYQMYSASIRTRVNDDLHMALFGDLGWGMPAKVFYTTKPVGAHTWNPLQDASATNNGVNPKLALEEDGTAHIVYEQRSGNILTGNIYYATNQSGAWISQYLYGNSDSYEPSLVVDLFGNCSMCFERYIGSQNYDVYYYGYVAPLGPPPSVSVTLTPYGTPIVIPPGGGFFEYNIALANNESFALDCDIWTMATLPSGSEYGPIINIGLNLSPGFSANRDRIQTVPASAPPGNYVYHAYIGINPGTVWDEDNFQFQKSAAEEGE